MCLIWSLLAKYCKIQCFKLFSNLKKENKLRQNHCRNSTKVGERDKK